MRLFEFSIVHHLFKFCFVFAEIFVCFLFTLSFFKTYFFHFWHFFHVCCLNYFQFLKFAVQKFNYTEIILKKKSI